MVYKSGTKLLLFFEFRKRFRKKLKKMIINPILVTNDLK